MNWHQQNAAARERRFRNHAAHIHRPDFLTTGLCWCGAKDPPVYVDPEHAHKEHNKTCQKCLQALYRAALESAIESMNLADEQGYFLEPTSALKQAAHDYGIPYGDAMGAFTTWAREKL